MRNGHAPCECVGTNLATEVEHRQLDKDIRMSGKSCHASAPVREHLGVVLWPAALARTAEVIQNDGRRACSRGAAAKERGERRQLVRIGLKVEGEALGGEDFKPVPGCLCELYAGQAKKGDSTPTRVQSRGKAGLGSLSPLGASRWRGPCCGS